MQHQSAKNVFENNNSLGGEKQLREIA